MASFAGIICKAQVIIIDIIALINKLSEEPKHKVSTEYDKTASGA